eukprot:gene13905-8837_t
MYLRRCAGLATLLCGLSALSISGMPLRHIGGNVRKGRSEKIEYCGSFLECDDSATVNSSAYNNAYMIAYDTALGFEDGLKFCQSRTEGGQMATVDGDEQLFYLQLLAQQSGLWSFRLPFYRYKTFEKDKDFQCYDRNGVTVAQCDVRVQFKGMLTDTNNDGKMDYWNEGEPNFMKKKEYCLQVRADSATAAGSSTHTFVNDAPCGDKIADGKTAQRYGVICTDPDGWERDENCRTHLCSTDCSATETCGWLESDQSFGGTYEGTCRHMYIPPNPVPDGLG